MHSMILFCQVCFHLFPIQKANGLLFHVSLRQNVYCTRTASLLVNCSHLLGESMTTIDLRTWFNVNWSQYKDTDWPHRCWGWSFRPPIITKIICCSTNMVRLSRNGAGPSIRLSKAVVWCGGTHLFPSACSHCSSSSLDWKRKGVKTNCGREESSRLVSLIL